MAQFPCADWLLVVVVVVVVLRRNWSACWLRSTGAYRAGLPDLAASCGGNAVSGQSFSDLRSDEPASLSATKSGH